MFEHFVLYLPFSYNTIRIKNAIIKIVNNLNIANYLIVSVSKNNITLHFLTLHHLTFSSRK